MKIILKTIFTSQNELLYILAQMAELDKVVDRFVIVEPGFTHTGEVRKLIGLDALLINAGSLAKKIEYIPVPPPKSLLPATQHESAAHFNERITRGIFVDYVDLRIGDVVISTDADEVLYEASVVSVLESRSFRVNPIAARKFKLHQFMYRDNLYADGFTFVGPVISKAARYPRSLGYRDWRYAGPEIAQHGGCHYSWCLPRDQLIKKVSAFAHGPSYFKGVEEAEKRIDADIAGRVYTFRNPSIPLKLIDSAAMTDFHPKGYFVAKKIWCDVGGERA